MWIVIRVVEYIFIHHDLHSGWFMNNRDTTKAERISCATSNGLQAIFLLTFSAFSALTSPRLRLAINIT